MLSPPPTLLTQDPLHAVSGVDTHTQRVPLWGGSQDVSRSVGLQPPTEGQGGFMVPIVVIS